TAAPSMLIASLSSEKLAAPPALAQSVETIVSGAKPATGAIVSAKAAGVAAAVLAFAVAFSAMLPHFRPEAPAALIPAVAPQLDEETKGDERTLEANEVSEELAKKLEKRISIRIDDDLRTVLQVLTMKSGVRIVCPLGAEMTPVVCSKENVRVKDVLTSLSRDLEIEIGSDNVAVWKKGDPAEWTRIKKDLESQDWTTRAKACAKLGRWGDRAACKTLLERIYDENYTTRIFALTSLSGFTPVLRHVELPASFEEHLLKQHKEAKDWVTRCSAIKLMGLCSSDESEKVIIEALTADEGMCREAAAQALCMRKSERAKEEVLKLIGHPSWVVRDVVGGALKECPYALAPLLEMAKRARLGVSEFSTLAFLGRESLWPEVSKLIEGGLEPQQENGICLSAYLLQMGDARPRETLATLLKHQDWKIRSAACWALWVSADDGLRDALINTAGADESDDTRSVALLALGRMNDPRATQWLLDQKPSEKDAVSFARALVEARHRQGFERLKTITGAGLERGIYGLTEMRTPEADQLLLDIADGRVPSTGMTRDAAAFCLAMNHHPHGLARLIKLSQDAVAHRGATPMLEQSLGVLLRLAPVIESDFDRDQLGALLNQIKDLRTLQKPAPAGDF
ncbi:MAG TPA: HEAT repeat domain-containing protein, partial [Planctomycetota bacterium]|nr:HEAT repeat domain-containing protein [Planctomycetota bacterium]